MQHEATLTTGCRASATLVAIVAALLGAATPRAHAQAAGPAAPQRVEISGSPTAADDRRDALVARVVVSREEIARHGDTSLVDVLRRVPGLSIGGDGGPGSELRLRGMGSGYTQILINGEPAPRGFTLESITPSQVERIEVQRSATVDQPMQSIAGSVNIVLREVARRAESELTAGVGRRAGRAAATLDGLLGRRDGGLGWSLGLGAVHRRERWPARIEQRASDPAGTATLLRSTQREAEGDEQGASLTHKLSWQPAEGERLQAEILLRRTRFDDGTQETRETTLGAPPPYAADTLHTRLHTGLLRVRAGWNRTLAGGSTLEARIGIDRLRRDAASALLGYDAAPALVMDERVDSAARERNRNAAVKLRLPYTQGHALTLGADASRSVRGEQRRQRQSSPIGRPTLDLDEDYRSAVTDWAVYLQDEWEPREGLAVYAGLRHAGLATRTEGQGLDPVTGRDSVSSPVLQILWKPGEGGRDQLRAALGRTYRAPRSRDLVPRRWVANDNTPTTPDFQGNPGLRPELAWGLDLGAEHFLPRNGGLLAVTAGWRRIRDLIVERLTLDARGWLSRRTNDGQASVQTLEIESRLKLRALLAEGPDLELRAAVARNRSRVSAVPGPDNRIDAQVPASANLGADWRPAGGRLALGTSWSWQQGLRTRSSPTQTLRGNSRSMLDAYALWKAGGGLQLRLGVTDLLHRASRTDERVFDEAGEFAQSSERPGFTGWRLTLELKL